MRLSGDSSIETPEIVVLKVTKLSSSIVTDT